MPHIRPSTAIAAIVAIVISASLLILSVGMSYDEENERVATTTTTEATTTTTTTTTTTIAPTTTVLVPSPEFQTVVSHIVYGNYGAVGTLEAVVLNVVDAPNEEIFVTATSDTDGVHVVWSSVDPIHGYWVWTIAIDGSVLDLSVVRNVTIELAAYSAQDLAAPPVIHKETISVGDPD